MSWDDGIDKMYFGCNNRFYHPGITPHLIPPSPPPPPAVAQGGPVPRTEEALAGLARWCTQEAGGAAGEATDETTPQVSGAAERGTGAPPTGGRGERVRLRRGCGRGEAGVIVCLTGSLRVNVSCSRSEVVMGRLQPPCWRD